jgi:hypothetical protein
VEKTLNDRVEEIFRGIVFIVFSFASSLVLLLCMPLRGYILLIKWLRVRGGSQIRPYAFVFFSFVLVFFTPSMLQSLTPPKPGAFEYVVHDSEQPDKGVLGRAYEIANKRVETKAVTAIIVAAVVGVGAIHLGALASGRGLIRTRSRRTTWSEALFFVAGLQIGLLALASLLDRAGFPSPTERAFFKSFLETPYVLVFNQYGEYRPYPIYLDVLSTLLLVAILIAPLGLALRYAPRMAVSIGTQKPKGRYARLVMVTALVSLVDFVSLASFGFAAYVADEVQPQDKPAYPFAMNYLDCTAQDRSGKPSVTGTVEVRAATAAPWGFDADDFTLFLGANRVQGDPPAKRRTTATDRIGVTVKGRVKFSAISPNMGSPPFLLQAGQGAIFRFETELPDETVAFLKGHPDDRRCTLSYMQDYPIGAIGTLKSTSSN